MPRRIQPLLGALLAAALLASACASAGERAPETTSGRASLLPDVSGLAWVGGDRFLAVHDAKYPDEPGLPRVSLLDLPTGLEGVQWRPLDLAFPGSPASDLESVARVPPVDGRPLFLVSESTEEVAEKPFSRRVFLIELEGDEARALDAAEWPVATRNVEGMAVAEIEGRLLFVFAERGHGEASSEIRWSEMTLEPFAFGLFRSAGAFTSPGPTGAIARHVSALEFDRQGVLYAASAEDPDDDAGPFRSAVYRIGRAVAGAGGPEILLDETSALLGTLDGLKVEALAAREEDDGTVELWVGVDDEYYGGTIRRLPARKEAP